MSDPLPNSEIILYQTEDGRTRIQCWFENETEGKREVAARAAKVDSHLKKMGAAL